MNIIIQFNPPIHLYERMSAPNTQIQPQKREQVKSYHSKGGLSIYQYEYSISTPLYQCIWAITGSGRKMVNHSWRIEARVHGCGLKQHVSALQLSLSLF